MVLLRHTWLAAGLLVAGCYEPFPPSGAPCNAELPDPCPSGQSCVRGTCRLPGGADGTDASIIPEVDAFIADGSPADVDADGVLNPIDNCRNAHNPDQHDEDTDGVGDVCDNCPHVANADQLKTREANTPNGAGDVCDPRQETGDTIQKFYSFHVPPQGTSTTGNWAIANDTYRFTGGGRGSLIVSGMRDKVTIEIAGQVDSNTPNLGIAITAGEANGNYHECGYWDCVAGTGVPCDVPNDFHNAFVDYWDGQGYLLLVGNHQLQQRLSGQFTIRMGADAGNTRISCYTNDTPRGPATRSSGNATLLVPGAIGVRSDFASYRLRYLVVFGHP